MKGRNISKDVDIVHVVVVRDTSNGAIILYFIGSHKQPADIVLILVPGTSFSASMPFRGSVMMASMVLIHDFLRDSMLSRSKYVKESKFEIQRT